MKITTLTLLAAAAFATVFSCSSAQCKANSDCPSGKTCSGGTCVAGSGGSGGSTGGSGGSGGSTGGSGGSGGSTGGNGGSTGGNGGSTGGSGGATGGSGGMSATGACMSPTNIAAAGTVTGSTTTGANTLNFNSMGGCKSTLEVSGPESVYKITVPASQRLTVDLTTPADAGWDTVVNLIGPGGACGDLDGGAVCVAGSDELSGEPEHAVYLNTTAAPVDVLIVVDGYTLDDRGAFSLTTSFAAPPAGDTCANPTPLTGPLTNLNFSTFGNDVANSTGLCKYFNGPDRMFSISVPPMQRLTVDLTADGGLDPALSISESAAACAASTCLGGVDVGSSNAPESLRYDNTTAAAKTMVITVDSFGSGTGNFSLNTTLGAIPAAPAGDTCASAINVAMASTITNFTATNFNHDIFGLDTTNMCKRSNGEDVVYKLTIPMNATLTVTVTSMNDTVINLIDGSAATNCTVAAPVCLAAADVGSSNSSPEVLTYMNTGAAKPVFVVVSQYGAVTMPLAYTVQFAF